MTRNRQSRAGLTLIELIVAFTILLILSTMALPVARVTVQRDKERRLREALTEMRKAIDRYKDMADAGRLGQVEPDTFGYPPSLEILVEGVTVKTTDGLGQQQGGVGQQGGIGQQGRGQRDSAFGSSPSSGFGNSQGGFGSQNSFGSNNPSGSGSGFGSSSRSGNSGFGSNSGSGPKSGFGNSGFGSSGEDGEQKIRFLRKIPVDPLTGTTDWGVRSVQDNPESLSWGGQNVFDVFTRSYDTALDGTKYLEW